MANCSNVQYVYDTEYIGDSLEKINNNFNLLSATACSLQNQLDNYSQIRTFFYYGPNAPTESETGNYDENTQLAYPSSTTIEKFVVSTTGLNLLPISKKNDVAWVIYQKTGWTSKTVHYDRFGSGSIPYLRSRQVPITRTIGINWGKGYSVIVGYRTEYYYQYFPYSWTTQVSDSYTEYAPVFVLYKLVHDGTTYKIDGLPKFSRAQTANTTSWNNPESWSIY